MQNSSSSAEQKIESKTNSISTSEQQNQLKTNTLPSKISSDCRILAAESYKCLETKSHAECQGNLKIIIKYQM